MVAPRPPRTFLSALRHGSLQLHQAPRKIEGKKKVSHTSLFASFMPAFPHKSAHLEGSVRPNSGREPRAEERMCPVDTGGSRPARESRPLDVLVQVGKPGEMDVFARPLLRPESARFEFTCFLFPPRAQGDRIASSGGPKYLAGGGCTIEHSACGLSRQATYRRAR